jgi:hypothetical protein
MSYFKRRQVGSFGRIRKKIDNSTEIYLKKLQNFAAICHVPSPAAKNDNIFGKTIQKLENGRAKMEMAQNGRRRQQHAFHSIELLLAPKAI